MLKNSNGFSMVETLVSFSIVITVLGTLIPNIVLLHSERKDLELKREALALLHDNVQEHLYDDVALMNKSIDLLGTRFEINWTEEGSLMKGCILWKGETRNYQECLYAIQ